MPSFKRNKLGQILIKWYIKTQILRYVSACLVGRKTYCTNSTMCSAKNDGLYLVVLEVGEVHLLVLHPHYADRHHLLDLLPPPLHILPVQVWQDQQHLLWYRSGPPSWWPSSCCWSTSSQAWTFKLWIVFHPWYFERTDIKKNYCRIFYVVSKYIYPQELWTTRRTRIMEVRDRTF